MSLIDSHCSLGVWPISGEGFRSADKLREKHLQPNGISTALVSTVEALFLEDLEPDNQRLLDHCSDSGDLRALPTVNPRYPGAEKRAALLADHPACAGIRLAPGFHHYRVFEDPVVALCAELEGSAPGVPVVITVRVDDERMRPECLSLFPIDILDLFALTQRFPRLDFLIQGALSGEIHRLIGNHEDRSPPANLFADISFVDGPDPLNDLIGMQGVPPENLLFGSGEPFLTGLGPRLMMETLEGDTLKAVSTGNARRIFRRLDDDS